MVISGPVPDLDDHTLADLLPGLVEPRLGPGSVTSLAGLKGGYSRRMWAFDLRSADGVVHPLVLCTDAPDGVVHRDEQTLDRQSEGVLLQALRAQGLAVPDAVAWGGADDALGVPFVVMERIAGATAVGPLVRDQRFTDRLHDLGEQMADILATVHRAPVPAGLLEAPEGEPSCRELRRWTHGLRSTPGGPPRVLADAAAWLATNPPRDADRLVVVHGDFRTGNLMYDDDGFVAVLDWEMAHLGDRLEDVAWAQLVCWRLGTGNVSGLVDDETWLASYETRAGVRIDRPSLRFWYVLGAMKMCVLAGRAIEITTDVRERNLLTRLHAELLDDLAVHLSA